MYSNSSSSSNRSSSRSSNRSSSSSSNRGSSSSRCSNSSSNRSSYSSRLSIRTTGKEIRPSLPRCTGGCSGSRCRPTPGRTLCVVVVVVLVSLDLFLSTSALSNEHSSCCEMYSGDVDDADSLVSSGESRLIAELVTRYRRRGTLSRPVRNSTDNITVYFQPYLMQILNFDVTAQVLTSLIWKYTIWKDEYLLWNPDDYEGVQKVPLYPHMIWTPDIMLFNNMDKVKVETNGEMLVVFHNGTVMWVPPVIYRSTCPVDMSNFPFDTQNCKMTFGSWTYKTEHMDLVLMNPESRALFSITEASYVENSEWLLIRSEAIRNIIFYPVSHENFTDLTFHLTLKRRPEFYVRLLLLPLILLSVIAPAIFWIPPSRPDRTNMGYSLFSSFFLQFLLIVNSSPPTSETKLATFCCVNIAMVAFATVESVLVINIEQGRYPVPHMCALLRKLCGCVCGDRGGAQKQHHCCTQICYEDEDTQRHHHQHRHPPDQQCRSRSARDIYGMDLYAQHTQPSPHSKAEYNSITSELSATFHSNNRLDTPCSTASSRAGGARGSGDDGGRGGASGGGATPTSCASSQAEAAKQRRHHIAITIDRVCFVLYVIVVIVCFILVFPYP